ncbi:hypothetical protein [Polyangium sp. y55x31]|uniref:hypothetical protein n=1 Tax=Polyangium sp. y55x31 TaxID=3042688 RepID=UPI00248234CB|nr:hypothetical protein [Polyangium sp. y55x31]MDI1480373.1 hypothetical protein [Polyangium sp. y55x31]
MSLGLLILAALAGALILWLFVWEKFELPGSIGWKSKRLSRREHDRRSRMSPDDLAQEVHSSIRYEQWDRFPSAAAILARSSGWSDQNLCDALKALLAEVAQEDQQAGRNRRDSNYFEFYDCGLAGILDVLEARLKGAAPTARR